MFSGLDTYTFLASASLGRPFRWQSALPENSRNNSQVTETRLSYTDELFSKANIDKFIDLIFLSLRKKSSALDLLKDHLTELRQGSPSLEELNEIKREQQSLYNNKYRKTQERPHPEGGNDLFKLLENGSKFKTDSYAYSYLMGFINGTRDIKDFDPRYKALSIKIYLACVAKLRGRAQEVRRNQQTFQNFKQNQACRNLAAIAMLMAKFIKMAD